MYRAEALNQVSVYGSFLCLLLGGRGACVGTYWTVWFRQRSPGPQSDPLPALLAHSRGQAARSELMPCNTLLPGFLNNKSPSGLWVFQFLYHNFKGLKQRRRLSRERHTLATKNYTTYSLWFMVIWCLFYNTTMLSIVEKQKTMCRYSGLTKYLNTFRLSDASRTCLLLDEC